MIGFDDFYNAPSESDIAIEELKEHLRNEVKSEILRKLEMLEKENKELREIKSNKRKFELEYQEKERQLEREYKQKERDLMNRPIQELLEIIQEEYYYVSYDYLEKDKCDKCNYERKLELIDPYGTKHYVNCPCEEKYKSEYKVKEKYIGVITEISKRNGQLKMWVKFAYKKRSYEKDDCYISGTYFDKDSIIYNFDVFISEKENEINQAIEKDYYFSNYTFAKKEEAQKFADYINNQIERKEAKK